MEKQIEHHKPGQQGSHHHHRATWSTHQCLKYIYSHMSMCFMCAGVKSHVGYTSHYCLLTAFLNNFLQVTYKSSQESESHLCCKIFQSPIQNDQNGAPIFTFCKPFE